jgi:DMSO reductase anchor subunit
MAEASKPIATWRRITAIILDFITVFFGGGYAIGALTGSLTADGFKLEGMPALLLLALTVIYFVAGNKYLGGTIWQRVLYPR